jgi:protein associated with RNAse G/E
VQETHIRALKADGHCYRSWKGYLLHSSPDGFVVDTPPGTEIYAGGDMGWVQEFSIRTFFLCDHYLHLLEVSNSSSEPVEIYVNIASPVKLEGNLLRYIDYELDIVCDLKNNLDPVIVDQIEFEEAKLKYSYCKELIDTCTRTSQSALSLVKNSLVKNWVFHKDPGKALQQMSHFMDHH